MAVSVDELRKSQKALCDEFVTNIGMMDKVMWNHTKKMEHFRRYTIRNQLLANHQLFAKTGEITELLAPYNTWLEVNRHVRKGEKALRILAPAFKKIEKENGEKEEKLMYFVSVPVFDLSQTDGEKFIEEEYIINEGERTFESFKSMLSIPVLESHGEIRRGFTDYKSIWVSEKLGDDLKCCVLFHELAHYKLHANEKDLSRGLKELEAETVSYMVASAFGIKNQESSSYIRNWYGENSKSTIENRGERLIKVAEQIIDELTL